MFNENLFRKKLIDLNISIRELSKIIGINEATLHRKIKGITDFSRNEMSIIKLKLMMNSDEFESIFFANELTETQAN